MRYIFFLLILFTSCYREIREESLLNNYSLYCIKNNLWEEARFYLERARTLSACNAKIENNLGVVYEYFGRKEDAISSYKRAIELEKERVYYENLTSISSIKIPEEIKNSTKSFKIKIGKNLPPSIDSSKIDRLGLSIYADDKNIIPYILQALKEQITEEAKFYIVYSKNLPYPKSKEEIKNSSLKLLCDNILLVNVSFYSVSDVRDFDVSTKFIKNENRYEFQRTYWTNRIARISFSLSLFDREGLLLFKKDFKEEVVKRYNRENPAVYDYSIFFSFLKKATSSFLSLMKPKEYIMERWLVKD